MTDTVSAMAVSVYEIPLDAPESDGTLTWDSTSVVIAEPRVGETTGIGYTYGPPACARLISDVLTPIVVGCDPFDVPAAWKHMVAAIRNSGRPGICSMAIAAVDVALWDLKAKLLGLPLCRLLGQAHPVVPVYGSGGFTSLRGTALAAQLASWVDAGIPRVKMKVGSGHGDGLADDRRRVRTARRAIGDTTQLFVDANGAYSRKAAVRAARVYSDYGVTWFEEPVSSDDLAGLREVRDATDSDVAAGEYGYDLFYFERMAATGAVDVVQADVSRCAGITEWLRVAAVAAAHNLDISGHCAPLLHLHVAAAVPNLRHVEYFADHVRSSRLLFEGCVQPRDGVLSPDLTRPGIGLELKRSDAAKYCVEEV